MIKAKVQVIKEFNSLPRIHEQYEKKHPEWAQNRKAIRHHVAHHDLSEFLRWSTITATMFTVKADYLDNEYDALMEDDKDRWMKAITESQVGDPHRFGKNEKVSGNLVHQAFHLMQFERFIGHKVNYANRIVEFGGGYGAMCAVTRRLGFRGPYHIFDLPEFSILQEYYINQLGLGKAAHFHRVDDYGRFPVPPLFTDWLIGCYSLSEVGYGLRDAFIHATNARYVLIAMEQFWGQKEKTYLQQFAWLTKTHKGYEWTRQKNDFFDGHSYVIGVHQGDD